MSKLSTSTAALGPTSFAIRPLLAAGVLLAALVVPCAYAQGPFIYVANAGEDTVSKIDVTLNQEVARYATWFTPGSANHVVHAPIPPTVADRAHQGPAPSRIAQDSAGNVYVLDRFWGPHLPVLLKIAPTGAPTSSGSGFSAVLPMLDNNPTNNDIDIPSEAADKRILWAKPIGNAADAGQLGRALAIDTTGILWVGIYGIAHYYRVNPSNGTVLAPSTGIPFPTIAGRSYGAYSAQVDVNGKLWSVDEHQTLTEIDTLSPTYPATPHDHTSYGDNYSVSIFNDCSTTPPKVKVYLPEHRLGKTYIVYDPQTGNFSNPPPALATSCPTCLFNSVAIGVDTNGNIVSGEWKTTGRVIKTGPSGNVLWDTGTPPPAQQIRDLHGLIIDTNNDVWVVDWYGNRVIKYSGANGSYLATVQVGDQPYTYGNTPPPTCSVGGSPTPTPTPTPTATPTATPGCAAVIDKDVRCLPDGSYGYTFNVANNSGAAMSQVLLTPVSDGTFTLAPELSNLSSPLASGQSTTVTTNIGHVKPGEKVCFFVSLLSDNAPCCIVQVCPTLPQCRESPSPNPSPPPPRR